MTGVDDRLKGLARRAAKRAVAALPFSKLPGGASAIEELSFPNAELERVNQSMYEYLQRNPGDAHAQVSATVDRVRFARTVEWLTGVLRPGQRVLELGGGGMSSHIVARAFSELSIDSTPFELRQAFPHTDATFDAILCMEVIEHLADEPYQYATTLSSVRRCLRECLRVLKPGGMLFLTTPNAASTFTISRAMKHEAPMAYEWHFRELSFGELRQLLTEAGFAIDRAETLQVWHFSVESPLLLMSMWLSGADPKHRGDDTFVIARKAP